MSVRSDITNAIFEGLDLDGRRDDDHEAVSAVVDRIMGRVADIANTAVHATLDELVASKTLITEDAPPLGRFYRGRLSGGQREHRELMAAVMSRVERV